MCFLNYLFYKRQNSKTQELFELVSKFYLQLLNIGERYTYDELVYRSNAVDHSTEF